MKVLRVLNLSDFFKNLTNLSKSGECEVPNVMEGGFYYSCHFCCFITML